MSKSKKDSMSSQMPPIVYAVASVKSVGGQSMFDAPHLIDSETVVNYYSESQLTNLAVERLRAEGFTILDVGDTTISIGASADVYERVFGTSIVAEERPTIKSGGEETTATYLECPDTDVPGLIDTSKSSLSEILEGVALEEPVYFFASAFAPPKGYWHLDVPGDVSLGLNADRAHRANFTGRGIRVAMVDSGHYRKHPFFVHRGYRVRPVVLGPAASNPDHDESGHGTGESANIFAVAPDVTLMMVKVNFVNSIGAFNAAVRLRPHIISCSWGKSLLNPPLSAADQAMAAAIANAVRLGIIVIFSAGNGHFGYPGQHPDVISAGGAFMHNDGAFEASNYASGFASRIYRGRLVPDVCGLVGQKPRAQYIMLPVEDGDDLDQGLAGGNHPAGDETQVNDGWAAFSGTSAAAPQIAGACALMKQANPHLTPKQARNILKATARDVRVGTSNTSTGGNPAKPGIDLATGHGVIDAFRATLIAYLRLFSRIPSVIPATNDLMSNGLHADEEYMEHENGADQITKVEELLLETWD